MRVTGSDFVLIVLRLAQYYFFLFLELNTYTDCDRQVFWYDVPLVLRPFSFFPFFFCLVESLPGRLILKLHSFLCELPESVVSSFYLGKLSVSEETRLESSLRKEGSESRAFGSGVEN